MINIVTDIKILRKPCEEATEKINIEAMAAALLHDLAKTAGAGLAANQIGFHYKVCVIAVGLMNPIVLVNPVITKALKPHNIEERCLSLPSLAVEIERYSYVKVKAFDVRWRKVKYTFRGTEAQCAQHEIDHLNGILMIDHLSESDKARSERFLSTSIEDRGFLRLPARTHFCNMD